MKCSAGWTSAFIITSLQNQTSFFFTFEGNSSFPSWAVHRLFYWMQQCQLYSSIIKMYLISLYIVITWPALSMGNVLFPHVHFCRTPPYKVVSHIYTYSLSGWFQEITQSSVHAATFTFVTFLLGFGEGGGLGKWEERGGLFSLAGLDEGNTFATTAWFFFPEGSSVGPSAGRLMPPKPPTVCKHADTHRQIRQGERGGERGTRWDPARHRYSLGERPWK